MEVEGFKIDNLKYSLFLKRRFLPIFLTVFLGSFNDNLLRSGLVVLIAYSASKGIELPTRPEILVTICSALLGIPLLLFSPIAGQVADKYEKSRLAIYTKIAEVGIMIGACIGFATNDIYLLMAMLFVSGTHSTFCGPIKFSILPEGLRSGELVAANGFMAGGTYIAMLGGLITGGFLIEMPGNIIGAVAIFIALIGLVASLFIPNSHVTHPETHIHWNIVKAIIDITFHATRDKIMIACILCLSWFMLVGSIYMAQFSNYAQAVVRGDNEVYILFLVVFSIGTAIGSLMCDTLLKGQISARFTPYAAAGIGLFTFLMVLATPTPTHEGFMSAREFLAAASHWPLLGCMLMVAVCGGIYIVPLYALLQSGGAARYRSRIIAASGLSDAVFMSLGALVSALLLSLGCDIPDLFIIMAMLTLGVVWYARKIFA